MQGVQVQVRECTPCVPPSYPMSFPCVSHVQEVRKGYIRWFYTLALLTLDGLPVAAAVSGSAARKLCLCAGGHRHLTLFLIQIFVFLCSGVTY